MFDFYLSLDLGQSSDYSALALIAEPVWIEQDVSEHFNVPAGWVLPYALDRDALQFARSENWQGRPPRPPLTVAGLVRWKLGTGYPVIVDDVVRMLRTDLRGRDCVLLVDSTGVGAAVADMFRLAECPLVAVTITGGHTVHVDGDKISVPKRELISATQVIFEQRKIQIAEALPEAAVLERELLAFTRKQRKETGRESFEAWRESIHDDLVLAVAMGIWYQRWFWLNYDLKGDAENLAREDLPVQSRVARLLQKGSRR